jgi:hypothetical protein
MNSSDKTSMDFWYEFDYLTDTEFDTYSEQDKKVYNNVTPEIRAAESQIFQAVVDDNGLFMGEGNAYDNYYRIGEKHSPNQLKLILMEPQYTSLRDALRAIANLILSLMQKHFKGNKQSEQLAFVQFGQGTLYDLELNEKGEQRRPIGYRIHMMDSGTGGTGRVGGYDFLHKVINLVVLLELVGTPDRWLEIDTYVGLGAEIHSIIKPKQSSDVEPLGANPNNQQIDKSTLDKLVGKWLNLKGVIEIDNEMQQLVGRALE